MTITEALDLVIELAEQGVVSDFDAAFNETMKAERAKQDKAIEMVRALSLTVLNKE